MDERSYGGAESLSCFGSNGEWEMSFLRYANRLLVGNSGF